jgi:hypothetical protein
MHLLSGHFAAYRAAMPIGNAEPILAQRTKDRTNGRYGLRRSHESVGLKVVLEGSLPKAACNLFVKFLGRQIQRKLQALAISY